MFKSGGQGAPSSSRSFDWYDCNSLTEIVKHARGIKKKHQRDKIYLYFSSFFFAVNNEWFQCT